MSQLEPADTVMAIVGVPRHDTDHIARGTGQHVYLLHSAACVTAHAADGTDLTHCSFSLALDKGIDLGPWEDFQDIAAVVEIDAEHGDLVPTRAADGHTGGDR